MSSSRSDHQNDENDIIDKWEIYFHKNIKAEYEHMKKILALKYKIVEIEPLIIEREGFPNQENVSQLFKITEATLTDTEYSKLNTDSSVRKSDHISRQFLEVDKCIFYFNKQLKFDGESIKKITILKFKIVLVEPLIVESEGFPKQENLLKITEILRKHVANKDNQENNCYSELQKIGSILKSNDPLESQDVDEISSILADVHINDGMQFQSGHFGRENITNPQKSDDLCDQNVENCEDNFPSASEKIDSVNPQGASSELNQSSSSSDDESQTESRNNPLHYRRTQLDEDKQIPVEHHSEKHRKNNSRVQEAVVEQNKNTKFNSSKDLCIDEGKKDISVDRHKQVSGSYDIKNQNKMTFMPIAKQKLEAAKIFYEDTEYALYLKSFVKIDDDYGIEYLPEDKKVLDFLAKLNDFEVIEINARFDISKIEKHFPGIRAVYAKDLLRIMGRKAQVLSACKALRKTQNESNTPTSGNVCYRPTDREKILSSLETPRDDQLSSLKHHSSVEQEINLVKFKDEDVEMCSDDTESETAQTYVSIEMKKFRAACVFYKDTKYVSYLTSALQSNNDYAIRFLTKDKKAQKFLTKLDDFELYEIDSTELTFSLSDFVEKKCPHIKVKSFEKNIFTLMGQKEDLLSAHKKILSFIDYNNKITKNVDKQAYERNKEKKLQSLEKFDDTRKMLNQHQKEVKTQLSNEKLQSLEKFDDTRKMENQHPKEVKTQLSNEKDKKQQKNVDAIPLTDSDKGVSSDETESEESFTIEERKFEAFKFFYKDTVYMSFIESAEKHKGGYELTISSKDKKAQEFITAVKDFKIFEIDAKTKVNHIISSLEREHPKTKVTCFGKNVVTLMSHKDHFQSAKSKILSLIGNNDEDTTWSAKAEYATASHEENGAKSLGMGNNLKGSGDFSDSDDSEAEHSSKWSHREQKEDPLRKESSKLQVGRRIIDRSSYPPVFVGCSKLKVVVMRDDITQQKVDCIVNAASKSLKHSHGVAGAIAKAAGPSMQQECDNYISVHKAVPVTGIFVSDAGLLSVQKIIHAVGPKWDDYSERDKKRCEEDLRRTVLRCLLEASKRKLSSIALPAISSAGFKVPSHLCAVSYVNAVKHFDVITTDLHLHPLKDICFIDINDKMVMTITDCFKKNWEEDILEYVYKEDLEFAVNHFKNDHSKSTHNPQNRPRGGSRPRNMTESRHSSIGKEYKIDSIKLYLSPKPAFDFKSDVVIIGKPFQKLSGLHNFDAKTLKKNTAKTSSNPKEVKHLYSQLKGKPCRWVSQVKIQGSSVEEMEKAIKNLKFAIAGQMSVVVTSNLFYSEENKLSKSEWSQVLSTFCKIICKFIKEYQKDNYMLKSVTITASEEAIPVMIKVMDSVLRIPALDFGKQNPPSGRKTPTPNVPPQPVKDYENDSKSKRDSSSSTNSQSGTVGHGSGVGNSQAKSLYPKLTDESQLLKDKSHSLGATADIQMYKAGTPVDRSKDCEICFENNAVVTLACCKKKICTTCDKKCQACPYCRDPFDTITGTQPDGTMTVKFLRYSAAGYEPAGSWEITYRFSSGKQESHHPNPGQMYSRVERTAYLPDVAEGFDILILLRLAFLRRLTFTIGKSLTTNKDNVITWNDIHHKTSLKGGSFGYPDSKYFQRVKEELSGKGVSLANLTEAERRDLDYFASCIRKDKMFF
ncbi:uncharacterized protein LOC131943422 [Physella acuta]|uniref:uncharacterized protein LOC131943422 n=1 Tax=Physella acuta TaxID=109671 RepID=UPI0027DE96F9|nr:uncharacterized protein LOC131943422 [Physella acuta]